jgi:peptidoglycan-associated lipoprotein
MRSGGRQERWIEEMKLIGKASTLLFVCAALSAAACTSTKEAEPAAVAQEAVKTPDQQLDEAIKLALDTVYFEFDSAALTLGATENLKAMAAAMKKIGTARIMIEGHTDDRGSNEYNLTLAQKRAESIKNFLMSEGVAAEAIETASFGEERPAQEGQDEAAFSKNRRGEFQRLK